MPRPDPGDRPWVALNLVSSVDGRIAVSGRVGALSTPPDRALFAHLRSLGDLILVGAATVRAEGYGPARMSAEARERRRRHGQSPEPPIAVVTRSADLGPAGANLVGGTATPLVLVPEDAPAANLERLGAGFEVLARGQGSVDLAGALGLLHGRGVRLVVCEGGAGLNADLLAAGLVDELCLTVAPVLGGDPLGLVARGPATPEPVTITHARLVDGSAFLRMLVHPPR